MVLRSEHVHRRANTGAELWLWTASLALCIISYPTVLLLRLSPWAGSVGAAAAAALLVLQAGLGCSGRRSLDRWPAAALASASGLGVGITAATADGSPTEVAIVAAGLTALVMLFAWYFVPALVRDAAIQTPSLRTHRQPQVRAGPSPPLFRPALSVVLLLGFLMLGAGALWHRGGHPVPNPAPWLITLLLLSLGLMFIERIGFFGRSAREGNLVVPAGSSRRWVGLGLAMILVSGLLSLALPRRTAREVTRPGPVGMAPTTTPPGPLPTPRPGLSAPGGSATRQVPAAGVGQQRLVALSLLLLLLLLALILIWGLSRTRAARWMLTMIASALGRLARLWQRLAALVGRAYPHPPPRSTAGLSTPAIPPDPLFDVFDHPELLGKLTPREVLIRTYHLLLNYAEMMGHGRHLGDTPFEYAVGLQAAAPTARDGLTTLTWGYAGAMYGQPAWAGLPAPQAVRIAWEQVSRALRGGMSEDDFALRRRAYLAARELERRARTQP